MTISRRPASIARHNPFRRRLADGGLPVLAAKSADDAVNCSVPN